MHPMTLYDVAIRDHDYDRAARERANQAAIRRRERAADPARPLLRRVERAAGARSTRSPALAAARAQSQRPPAEVRSAADGPRAAA